GMAAHHERLLVEALRLAADLAEDLVGHRHLALDLSLAVAIRAGLVERAADALAHPLAGHLDQAELADLEHVGLGAVAAQGLLHGLEDLVAVLRLIHVDEVDDDDAADVA